MNIEYLADSMEHVPVLAKWFQDQWGYLSPERSLEDRVQRLGERTNRTELPITFVALEGDEPVGSASLVECDMDTRSHLKPWLASVYVVPSYRNCGVGAELVGRVLDEANSHGFSTVYLWTPSKKTFYAKRGWSLMETTTYRNEHADVMSFSMTP
jgi:N-acetylglutamate synthase-like GNAT family acetyltransferase